MKHLKANSRFCIDLIERDLTPAFSDDERARAWDRLCDFYRMHAVALLLHDADVETWRDALAKSAKTRIRQLRLTGPGADLAYFRRASRVEPFCDALAAAHDDLAAEIVLSTPDTLTEGEEHLEDFRYARLLYRLFSAAQEEDLQPEFEAYENALQGNLPACLDVMRALVEENELDLRDALEAWVDERDTMLQDRLESPIRDPELEAANQAVFIEGLAVLRLAFRAGLSLPDSYRFMPDIARPDR